MAPQHPSVVALGCGWDRSPSGLARQPLFAKSIKPGLLATSPVGYIRLHGRNYKNWFTENRETGERYNYLYSLDELEPWVERAKIVSKRVKDAYLVTNDRLLGKAVVNTFQLTSLLSLQREPPEGCPVHEYHAPSFAVFPATGTFYCCGCQKLGDVISFLREMKHLAFAEVLDRLDATFLPASPAARPAPGSSGRPPQAGA